MLSHAAAPPPTKTPKCRQAAHVCATWCSDNVLALIEQCHRVLHCIIHPKQWGSLVDLHVKIRAAARRAYKHCLSIVAAVPIDYISANLLQDGPEWRAHR